MIKGKELGRLTVHSVGGSVSSYSLVLQSNDYRKNIPPKNMHIFGHSVCLFLPKPAENHARSGQGFLLVSYKPQCHNVQSTYIS